MLGESAMLGCQGARIRVALLLRGMIMKSSRRTRCPGKPCKVSPRADRYIMEWNNPYKWPKIHGFSWGYDSPPISGVENPYIKLLGAPPCSTWIGERPWWLWRCKNRHIHWVISSDKMVSLKKKCCRCLEKTIDLVMIFQNGKSTNRPKQIQVSAGRDFLWIPPLLNCLSGPC